MKILTGFTTLLCIVLLLPNGAFAQQKKVSGRVHTTTGVGISGASVYSKGGGKKMVLTDSTGNFSFLLATGDSVLKVSAVGFLTRDFHMGNIDVLDISLEDDPRQLTEVVVTAMGIKKEDRKIGYAVQQVKGEDLTKARESNPIAGLTGKVAGLSVGPSAELLGRPNVVLRGNKDLLYVVDGVPINSDSWNISPDDIETYTVLKGPNAAALYGFRGQNGAIVMTTRKGTKNKRGWQVNFNTSDMIEHGFLALPKPQAEYGRGAGFLYEYASGYTYGNTGTDVLYDNSQRLAVWGPRFEGQQIKQYNSSYDATTGKRGTSAWLARGTNNLKNFLESGMLSTNNISAAASGDNYDVRMSYSHTYQKGMAPNTKLNIDNLNLITNYRFSDKVSAEASLNFNTQYSPNIPDATYGPNSFVYELSVYGATDYDVRDLKNYYGGSSGVQGLMQLNSNYGRDNNPYFQSYQWLRGHYKTDLYGYIKLNYKINDDMNFSVRSQVTTWNQTRTEDVPAGAILNTYLPWYSFGSYYGDYREDKRTLIENNSDALFSYNKRLKSGWNLSALAGGSYRSFKYNSSYATTQNLNIPGVYDLQNSKGTAYIYSFKSNMMVYSGYYSVDLGYKKFFNVSTTGRVDNLSTLPAGNRTFFYPSVALSSVISDYVNLPEAISYLKVRGSYADVKSGLTQSTAPSAYMAITGISTNTLLGYGSELYTSYDGPTYSNQMGISNVSYYNGTPSVSYSSTISNSNLKPADNKSYEGGFDVRFMHDRLGLSATYFVSQLGPQIYSLPVAASTSFAAQNVNGIITQKKGIELTVNAQPLKSAHGLNWNITANYSTYVERLKKIYGNESGLTLNGHVYKAGDRMDDYYGTGFVRTSTGQIVYSGGLPMANPSTALGDKKYLGHLNPDFSFGINNNFSYHNFNFSFQFDGRVGGVIYDRVYYQMTNGGTSQESVSGALGAARLKEWQSTSQGSVAPTPYYVGQGVVVASGTPQYSKGVITNSKDVTFAANSTPVTVQSFLSSGVASNNEYYTISRTYAKLREVTLGYTVPAQKLQHSFVKGATISLVGRNLLYFAKRKDFDIDQYSSGYNASDNSVTYDPGLQSPTARRYGVNINLTF